MVVHQVTDPKIIEQFFKRDYHDRGMLKWGGYFLSDHTSAIQGAKKADKPETSFPSQSQELVSKILMKAWQTKHLIHAQLNQLTQGEVVESVEGQVLGVDEDQIIIQSMEQRIIKVQLDEIRNVRWVDELGK